MLIHLFLIHPCVWQFLIRASALAVMFILPFWHTHTAHSHTVCGRGFKLLTLSLPRGAVRRGANHRPPRSTQAAAMWYVETVGSKGGDIPLIQCTPPSFIPEKTERGRDWQLTMKSWQFIAMVTGGLHSSGVNSVTGAWFCHGWVFQRIWGRVRVHMAKHVNPFSSQLT